MGRGIVLQINSGYGTLDIGSLSGFDPKSLSINSVEIFNVFADTTYGRLNIILPSVAAFPTAAAKFLVFDAFGKSNINNIIVTTADGTLINGASSFVISAAYRSNIFQLNVDNLGNYYWITPNFGGGGGGGGSGSVIIQTTTAHSYVIPLPTGFTINLGLVFLGALRLSSPANASPGYSWNAITSTLTLTQGSVKAGTELSVGLQPI